MATRYLFKQGDIPKYVHIWTEALAVRKDMVECDLQGNEISAKPDPVEAAPETVELPLIGVVDAPPFVPPAVDDGLPDIKDITTDAAPDLQERVLEIQARLSAMKTTEIRQAIKNDFNGAKAPAGISKLQLVEAYIQLDSASRA